MCRLVVVVTGANGGLGLGICQRLLLQLAEPVPSDSQVALPVDSSRSGDDVPLPCEALTLIMACRNFERAKVARGSLLQLLDKHVERVKPLSGYDGHAERFRDNLKVEIHVVDLSKMSSVFAFSDEITQKYPYISHMVFNAGAASWSHMDWLLCFRQFFVDPVRWITNPDYHFQHVGETSGDGLGWVWQTNLFGHFALFRLLQPLLAANEYTSDSRVVWLSSNTALPQEFDIYDWQILNSDHSYEAVKYSIDILATQLDQVSLKLSDSRKRVRHLVAHPSICSTDFGVKISGRLADYLKVMCFYIARIIGSTVHVIRPFLAAMSMVHVMLVPLSAVTSHDHPVKYGTLTNRWGTPYVKADEIDGWTPEQKQNAATLVKHCDDLLATLRKPSTA